MPPIYVDRHFARCPSQWHSPDTPWHLPPHITYTPKPSTSQYIIQTEAELSWSVKCISSGFSNTNIYTHKRTSYILSLVVALKCRCEYQLQFRASDTKGQQFISLTEESERSYHLRHPYCWQMWACPGIAKRNQKRWKQKKPSLKIDNISLGWWIAVAGHWSFTLGGLTQ